MWRDLALIFWANTISGIALITAFLAEREGFEPPIPFRVYRFSRPTVSTAHTPLRVSCFQTVYQGQPRWIEWTAWTMWTPFNSRKAAGPRTRLRRGDGAEHRLYHWHFSTAKPAL